jgi:hypothetical protein
MATPGSRTPALRITFAAALALVAAACGGSEAASERIAEEILERAAEQAGEGRGDVDVDFDLDGDGSGGVSVDMENGQMAMGQDLPRPDWLPGGFPLPDDLNITYAVLDNEVSAAGLGGDVAADPTKVRDDHIGAMESWGARLVNDVDSSSELMMLAFVLPDGRVARTVYLDPGNGGTQFSLEIREEDLERLEFEVSGPKQGSGVGVAVIDGERYEAAGRCEIGPDYASFSTDGGAGGGDDVSITVSRAGEVNMSNATVSRVDLETGDMVIWLLAAAEGNVSQGEFDTSSITAEGQFSNMMGELTDPTPGTIEVRCD